MPLSVHEQYMHLALREAERAAESGEVPTGCIIVRASPETGEPLGLSAVIGRAHNQTELLHDPTAHAEMIAITQAANALGDWRLLDTILYVTKEPCAMCAGAIIQARIPTVVYGLPDPLRGGISVFGILDHPQLNHRAEIVTAILEDECRHLLQSFFRSKR